MSQTVKFAAIAILGSSLLFAIGCGKPAKMDAEAISAYRTELTLSEEPDGIQTVADVRLTLVGGTSVPHDHDGDGKPDHAAEDHDAHADEHDGHDHDGEGHDEDGEDHDHDSHAADHDAEDHSDLEHDHDGDGKADHAAGDHDSHGHDEHAHEHHHGEETAAHDVVMVGHIGGLANPWAGSYRDYPFQQDEAIIFVADPQAVIENEESGHKHAPGEECAFCAAHAADKANMLAMVRFVDEKGEVLRTDARELFDVKEQDTVVVSGKARVTAGGILVVDARGLYIRN